MPFPKFRREVIKGKVTSRASLKRKAKCTEGDYKGVQPPKKCTAERKFLSQRVVSRVVYDEKKNEIPWRIYRDASEFARKTFTNWVTDI